MGNISITTDASYPIMFSSDNRSAAQQEWIDMYVRKYVNDQRDFFKKVYKIHAPRGELGLLRSRGLKWTRKIREIDHAGSGNTYWHNLQLAPIKDSRIRWQESDYPFWVNYGTTDPITPRAMGNVMRLRNKKTGIPYATASSVAGQPPQLFWEKSIRLTKTNFGGIEKYNLGRKIAKIIATGERL